MNTVIPILIIVGMAMFIAYARTGGGGKLGRKIRNSDHWALEDAIRDKEKELEDLKKLRPQYPIHDESVR